MLGNLIGSFIVIVVGTSLAPTVAQNVGTAQADGNITGASDTLLGLTTLFYCLSIATSAMASAAIGKLYAHKLSNLFMHKPESRLKSKVLKYLDKTEASIQKPYFEYARTTDKGFSYENDIQSGLIQ
jgi:hypothetical protein